MKNWNNEQLIFITKAYFSEGQSTIRAQRSFQRHYKTKTSPSKKVVLRCAKKISNSGNIRQKKPGRPVSVTNQMNIEKVNTVIQDTNTVSLRHLSQQVGISYSSTQNIVKKKLQLHAYKVQVCHQLQPGDFTRRIEFCEWFLQNSEDQDFLGGLIMSDEAHFSLNGHVNRQNMRFWARENPNEIMEVPLHSERVTVWCGLMQNCIIGPFFFEDGNEKAVTVNGERYHDMLTDFFIPQLEEIDRPHIHFQQDGATCHTTRENMTLLREQFPGNLISRFGDIEWPARSPDLTPLDFFLWGYLKARVYRHNPQTITELKQAIVTETRSISSDVTKHAIENMKKRTQ